MCQPFVEFERQLYGPQEEELGSKADPIAFAKLMHKRQRAVDSVLGVGGDDDDGAKTSRYAMSVVLGAVTSG